MEGGKISEKNGKRLNSDDYRGKDIYMRSVCTSSNIVFGLLNNRSITPKVDIVYEMLCEGLDILVLTETWHRSSDDISVKMAMPTGFSFVDRVRISDPCHGGLIIYFSSKFKIKNIQTPVFKTFEVLALKIFINKQPLILLAIYRPGSTQPSSLFFTELRTVLEHITLMGSQIIVAGDFNVHVERAIDPHTISLIEIFDEFNLVNRINESTHVMEGILDLIVTSHDLPVINRKIYPSGTFSDHSLIHVCFFIEPNICKSKKKLVRSWKRMDECNFISLIKNSSIGKPCESNNVDDEYIMFNETLQSIVDAAAPLHYVKSRVNHIAPWFDDECRSLKRECRKFERQYKNKGGHVCRSLWICCLKAKAKIFSVKRNKYWSRLIEDNSNNPKKLWSVVNKVLCKKCDNDLSTDSSDFTANQFMYFFRDKIDKVRQATNGAENSLFAENVVVDDSFLSSFSLCTEDDVRTIVLNSPTKTCLLDNLPTHIFKKYLFLFIPFLTSFINLCFEAGQFPSKCKHALIVPLLKKPHLDKNEINNYRPVSNLSFLSKVVERVVVKNLLDHLKRNNLLPIFQSGYRHNHSTETALL